MIRSGLVTTLSARRITFSGRVAEKKWRATEGPAHAAMISSTCSWNPKSRSLSASSKTRCRQAFNETPPSLSFCTSLRGVETPKSSRVFWRAAEEVAELPSRALSSIRPLNFFPIDRRSNSRRVWTASSRVGHTTSALQKSLPGPLSAVRMGSKKATVLPLPVGADAKTLCPLRIAGTACICTAVGLLYLHVVRRFSTSHEGTPRDGKSSKVSKGPGVSARPVPPVTLMPCRRRST
mmetsp:Transcript_43293/g.85421  ORF Transcript_43293/g.85421 Transcript_43293/m.85421 type:complete len:236 (+) Transcript_43293:899-1606(+)